MRAQRSARFAEKEQEKEQMQKEVEALEMKFLQTSQKLHEFTVCACACVCVCVRARACACVYTYIVCVWSALAQFACKLFSLVARPGSN